MVDKTDVGAARGRDVLPESRRATGRSYQDD